LFRRSEIEFLRGRVSVVLLKSAIKVANSASPIVNKQPSHFTIVKNTLLKEKYETLKKLKRKSVTKTVLLIIGFEV